MTTNAQSFFQFLATAEDVERLVGKSEDLYFDAKTLTNESMTDDSDKQPLAKTLSAFANADGGVIIYGLEAKRGSDNRDVVQAVKPLKDTELVRSRILALIGQLIQPPVEGIIVASRRKSDGSGYVIVFVPPSDSGPHRARPLREYYRRHGSSSLPMEHYELEEMFGRRRRPKLELYSRIKHQRWGDPEQGYSAVVHVGLRNTGRAIAKYPGLLLKNCKTWAYGTDGNGNWGLPPLPASEPNHLRHGGSIERVIYPGVDLDVTVILHPVQLAKKIGDQTIACEDLVVEYEIYAEDMPTVKSALRISSDSIIRSLLAA
ncbi:MAG TPA: ATP-binding protein [Candidatus Binataceae bacterium]|nr:ATP-binding protein [Candidatus Binataceae bacterium]